MCRVPSSAEDGSRVHGAEDQERTQDLQMMKRYAFKCLSQKEREDLALELLNNDLNEEKQNLCDKARRHYTQVYKQDGNKRLQLDTSKEDFEDVERERKEKYDDFDKRGNGHDDLVKGPPQSTSLKDQLIHSDRGQIQGEAKYQERIQVGSSFVSNWDTEDLQMLKYVFERLSPRELVFQSPRLYLTQNDFITLKPETWLNSWVIDSFVEILTESEKKKATPSNCYLPVTFSTAALKYDEQNFEDFVDRQNMRENYIFHIKSPEKVFIPVHTGQETLGHFYLYIFYLNKNVIEIWDSLPDNKSVAATERDETIATKLLFSMEILFEKEKGAFSNYKLERANDILSQRNGYDCGVFVINYMQQSDNYVKRNPLFQFDSQKERKDLALKLLTNDLNQEKQNLYDKTRGRLYAQVEKQDGNERLPVDPSKEHFKDVGRETEAEYDDFNEDDDSDEDNDGFENAMNINSDEDDDGLENGGLRYGGIKTEYSESIAIRNMNLTDIPAILPRDTNELFIYGCQKDTGSLCNALSYGRRIERLRISNTEVKSLCCLSSLCPFCSPSQHVGCLDLFKVFNLKDIVSPDALLSLHQPSLFCHLTDLKIQHCFSMETLMTPKLLALFRNLRTILISNCWKMKDIIGEDDHSEMELGGSGDFSHPTPITIPKLRSLKLEDMMELNFVYRGVMLCPSLQTFSFHNCKKLNPPRIEISHGCELPMTKTSTEYHWKI